MSNASNKSPVPSALPISDKPVTLSFNKGGPGSKPIASLSGPKAPAQISLGFSAEDFAADDDDVEAATSAEDNKGSFICSRQSSEYKLTFVLWQRLHQRWLLRSSQARRFVFSVIVPENRDLLTLRRLSAISRNGIKSKKNSTLMPAYRFADMLSHEEHAADHSGSTGQSAACRHAGCDGFKTAFQSAFSATSRNRA
jgi:hypothetical protein